MPLVARTTSEAGKALVVIMPDKGVLVVSDNGPSTGFLNDKTISQPVLLTLALHLAQPARGCLCSTGFISFLCLLPNPRAIRIGPGLGGNGLCRGATLAPALFLKCALLRRASPFGRALLGRPVLSGALLRRASLFGRALLGCPVLSGALLRRASLFGRALLGRPRLFLGRT